MRAFAVVAACVAATALAHPAASQTLDLLLPPDVAGLATEPDVTVVSRRRPEYDSPAIRLGAFRVRPSFAETAGYETNVLGTSRPKGSPVVTTFAGLAADTDQSRVNGSASLTVNDVRFTSQPSQDHTDWSAGFGGGYSLGRDVLAVNYSHQNLAETLQDLGVSRFLTRALPFRIDDGRVSYRAEFARTFLVPAVEVTNYAYDNVQASGVFYRQDYRDRLVVQPSLTAGYQLAPRRRVIAVVRDSVASYPTTLGGVPARDYNDVTVLGGVDYDVTGIFRVRALVGYQVRSFNSSQYKTIQAPVLEASATWNVTGLTTLTGSGSRAIVDSPDLTSAAVTETQGRLRVDHEYYRNVLLEANAGIAIDDYARSGSQTLYSAGVGATYLMNRNASIVGTYDFVRRESTSLSNLDIAGTGSTLGPSYSDHRILVQVKLRL